MSESRRKIWKLYELLSEKELPICEAWITASVGGPTAKLAKLLKAMRKGGSDEVVWKRVYANEPLNDNRLRQLFFDLSRYLEDFIAFQQFRKAPFQRDLYLIKGLNRRGLAETFRYFYRKVKQRWERQPIRNSRYYWALYELEGESLHHASKFPSKNKQDYVSGVASNLEQAIILDLMRNTLFYKSESKSFTEVSYLGKLEEVGRGFIYMDFPLFKLYSKLYNFLYGDEVNPEELIINIKGVWESSQIGQCMVGDKSEFLNFGYLILNKLIGKNNSEPNVENQTRLFEFYIWMIEQELLQVDGSLAQVHYRNVVTYGLALKRWAESKEMIENYIRLIPKSNRDDAYAFGFGRYLFYTRNYSQSLKVLNRKFGHYLEDLIARFYSLQGQYELDQFGNILYQIDLLKSFINRHKKLSNAGKSRYLAKANYFVRLIKATKEIDYRMLKDEIEERKDCASPEWLIEKCAENIL